MIQQYKVGNKTQYGTLLAEALTTDINGHINSLYADVDNAVFVLIEWGKSDDQGEFELERTEYPNLAEARRFWLIRTFGIIV